MATYKALKSGFIIGKYYDEGAAVPLTAMQAKYLSAPYGNDVQAVDPKGEDKPAPKAK